MELKEFLASKSALAPATIRSYTMHYNTIRRLLQNDIVSTSESDLVKAIGQLSNDNPSNEWTYLNVPIMVRRLFGVSTNALEHRRDELNQLRDKYILQRKKEIHQTLPSYEELHEFLQQLFNAGQWQAYIINYLLLTYGVRNKDLDVVITDKNALPDNNTNYIIVKNATADWHINDYKTMSKYGPKKIIIRNKQFMIALHHIPLYTHLLGLNGKEVSGASLSTTIAKKTYKGLGETVYFKVLMNHINNSSNALNEVPRLSKSRGTNISTILKHYHTGVPYSEK